MKLSVYSVAGKVVDEIELDDRIFGTRVNITLMHQAVVQHEANRRAGSASTKTRAQVTGTTKKMYKQKGTGRARHGSRKVPSWTGGGVAHGPHPRSYEQRMPKKMRRQAIRSALSVKARDNQLVVLDEITFAQPRTKEMIAILGRLPVKGKVLLALAETSPNVTLSARNLPDVSTSIATSLSTRELIRNDYLVATVPAIRAVERWLTLGDDATPDEEATTTPPLPSTAAPATATIEPAPTRAPRARKTAEETAAPAPALVEAAASVEVGPLPRRQTRGAKPATDSADAPAEASARPRRASRATGEAAAAPTESAAAETPKPRARRTKPEASE